MKKETTRALTTLKINFWTTGLLITVLTAAFGLNVFAQDTAERIILEPKEIEGVIGSDKAPKAKIVETVEKISSNELITAATYAFLVGASSLHDMSSGTTQLIGPNVDDTASAVTNIGFDFWYDGVRYTQFSCNANGVCRLGPTAVGTTFTNSLASTTNAPKIAPYFDDLWVGTNGKVHYKVINVAPNRELVVEWSNMQIPRVGTGNAGAGTFQMTLTESVAPVIPGAIRFFYGTGVVVNSANAGYSIGIQSGAATNFASITSATDTVSYAAATDTQTTAITANKVYGFNPNIPAAPSNNLVSGITPTSLTLNWLDNATNEVGYVIYRSTDNVNFTFLTQTAANATSYTDTGLTPSTNYFYNVHAVTEGALSALTSFGATTLPAGNDTCAGLGGNWNTPGTWTDGSVPTAGDNVTIGTGCLVTIDSSEAFSITIQNSGVLQFENTTARTLTVGGNVTIDAGGLFQSGGGGTVTTHVLSVGGSITNNGIIDFSRNTNMAGANITFAPGASNVTFGGTGTNDIRGITVNKGAQAIQVEMLMLDLTVQGVNTDVAGYLTITSGTFKISGNFTMTNRTFATPTYVIPLLGGFWLNNPNYTVAATASGTTTNNSGLFRMTTGIYNIGLTGADGMGGTAGATFIVEGGVINAIRIDPQSAVTFTMTGGIINLSGLAANTRSNFGSFELFSTTAVSTFDGGTINLINATVAGTPVDFRVNGTVNTGASPTVVNVGTAATATNFNFRMSGQTPSVVIDNTTNNKTATFIAQTLLRGNITVNPGTTFAVNGFLVAPTAQGGFTRTMTNNGAITGNAAGSRLYFLGQLAGSNVIYTGTGVAGTVALPLVSVDFDSVGGVALGGATNNLITNRVILFTGNVTGAAKLECGVGGASVCTTQVGNTTTPTAAGTFDATFTHMLGTGGQVTSYLRTTTPYTLGGEVNSGRTLVSMNIDPNTTNHIVGGGNIVVTGTMTLTTGFIVTSATNLITHNGTAVRAGGCTVANCYVDGPLRREYPAIGVYTFHVGENGYAPVLVNLTATSLGNSALGDPHLTVEAFDATLAGMNPPTSTSRNWALTEVGTLTADLSFTYNTDANDVNGNEADYRAWRRTGTGMAFVFTDMCGAPCVNVGTNTLGPVIGVTQFSRWAGGEAQVVVAANVNIGGRVTAADGIRGLGNVQVTLSGDGLPRTAITNPFGYYNFEDLEVGRTYVLTVGAKQYTFTNPTIIVTPNDNIGNADFIGAPLE